jgi:putative oxidoreductase
MLWILTIVLAVGIGIAGATKLVGPRWNSLFLGWGYAAWFRVLVGIIEVAGAICLLVPRLAAYAAVGLTAVMCGALVTLVRHPGGRLGWGQTPLVYAVLLVTIVAMRWVVASPRSPSP